MGVMAMHRAAEKSRLYDDCRQRSSVARVVREDIRSVKRDRLVMSLGAKAINAFLAKRRMDRVENGEGA